MAGHSKWANIKHKKGAVDAKRGKLFTKLIREITIAAKLGGGDEAANPRLRAAVLKALSNNMTRDTIGRAVKRGAGGLEGGDLEEIRYEGYGPNGLALIVDCLTDNKNRTVAEVRHVFSKMGGSLGTTGSVAFNFERLGQLFFDNSHNEEQLMEAAIEAGAEDVLPQEDGSFVVNTLPENLEQVTEAMTKAGYQPADSETSMVPGQTVSLDLDAAQKFMKMVDMLEDLDDVQSVYSNADIPEEIGKQL
tara:strand:- start:38718 stop:39461 length:744 start_codon:yes stop_codon:yes gene_type:complete